MSYSRYRAPSPHCGGFFDPMRASTGNMVFGSDMDPYYYPSRTSYDGYNTSRISGDRYLDPYYRAYYQPRGRPNDDWASGWQPSSSKAYHSSDKPSTSQIRYPVRPRSNTSSVADSNRRPLSVIVPSSPNRLEGTRSPRQPYYYAQDGGDRYIMPASSLPTRHRRIVSADDRGPRSAAGEKEVAGRADRPSYTSSDGKRRAHLAPPLSGRPREVDTHGAYSYTNAKEQFYRDSDAIRDYRRENHRRRKERPLSFAGLEKYLPHLSNDHKYEKPPSSSRHLDTSEKDGSRRPPERRMDRGDAPGTSDMSHRRISYKTPVLHQGREAPAHRGEHGGHRESGKHRERHNDFPEEDEHSHRSSRHDRYHPAPIPSGLATAGLASGYSKDLRGREYESDADPRLEHHRYRESDRRREPRRSERSARYESGSETDEYHSDMEAGRYRHQPIGRRKDRPGIGMNGRHEQREKDSKGDESDSSDRRRSSRHPHEKVHLDNKPTVAESGDTADKGQSKPQPIDKTGKELEVMPKSILKTPTEKFPEDKNAVREGVAPLKDAHKKGIPPGARWTKIDRRFVSPAALEGQERYEERPDYVIVLRVLSKEEIQEYAIKSAEIRARYDLARRRRDEDDERRRRYDTEDESSEDGRETRALPAP